MRIGILTLDGLYVCGESTYAYHLMKGLEALGHEVEFFSINYFGKKYKASDNAPVPITWLKIRDVACLRGKFDVIHVTNAKYKPKPGEYDYLKPLEGDDAVKTFLCHSHVAWKCHDYEQLAKAISWDASFDIDDFMLEQEHLKWVPEAHFVEPPFDRTLAGEWRGIYAPREKRGERSLLFLNSRFAIDKTPMRVFEVLEELKTKATLKIHTTSGNYYMTMLYGAFFSKYPGRFPVFLEQSQDSIDKHTESIWQEPRYYGRRFKLTDHVNVVFEEQYDASDRPHVYLDVALCLDGTDHGGRHGPNRTQYTTLEAMHFGVPPVTSLRWKHDYVYVTDLTTENVALLLDNPDARRCIVETNEWHLEEHFRADLIAQKYFVDVWEHIRAKRQEVVG